MHELLNKHAEARKKIGYMAKNNRDIKLDAQSILQRAPRLIISSLDSSNSVLPREKIYINAFGVVDEAKFFNHIPSNIFKSLDNL